MRPVSGSMRVSSSSAEPRPISSAPSIWLRAVLALTIRPASTTHVHRDTRGSPVHRCTRTSQKCAPKDRNAWVVSVFFGDVAVASTPGTSSAVSSTPHGTDRSPATSAPLS